MKNLQMVSKLISGITDGERFVDQGHESMLRELPGLADQISQQRGNGKVESIKQAKRYTKQSIARLRKTESGVKKSVN